MRRTEGKRTKTISLICVKIGRPVRATVVQRFIELDPGEIIPLGAYVRECDGQYECGVATETASDGASPAWEFDFCECPLNEALGNIEKR